MKILVDFALEPNDFLYSDYCAVSSNNPSVSIQEWHITPKATEQFDADFKEQKKVIAENPHLEIIALCPLDVCDAAIHVDYYQKSKKKYLTP